MQRLLKNRELLLALIILVMIAGFATRAAGFAAPANLANIFNDTSILIILALGQMTVILAKSIDLSVAANLAFTGMAVARALEHRAGEQLEIGIVLGDGIELGDERSGAGEIALEQHARYLRERVWGGNADTSWIARNDLLRNGPVRDRGRLIAALDLLQNIRAIWITEAPRNKKKFVNLYNAFFAAL